MVGSLGFRVSGGWVFSIGIGHPSGIKKSIAKDLIQSLCIILEVAF